MPTLSEYVAQIREALSGTPTVDTYLLVLSSKLTQYDKRQEKADSKRGIPTNIHRLGLYFQALDRVKKDVSGLLQNSDPESLKALSTAMTRYFAPDFPPVKNVLKQMAQGTASIVK